MTTDAPAEPRSPRTFTPLCQDEQLGIGYQAMKRDGSFNANGRTILVVDDDDHIRRLLGMALPSYGFRVVLAANGRKAVELYRRNHADIDLALVDIRMPGLDGPGTVQALKTINPDVLFCFMSGNFGDYQVEDLLGMGAVQVLPKPFPNLYDVAQMLRQVIDNSAA
jgi:CheY-like chemotaxis protein